MPFDEYLALPFWSQSTIKEALKSAAHAKAAREVKPEPTDAMVLGTAFHLAFLEPDEANEKLVTWEGKVRRGKDWDEFRDLYNDKIILTKGQAAQLAGMMTAMRASAYIAEISKTLSDVEIVEIGTVAGLRCKGRVDALACSLNTGDIIFDIKKVASADPWKFQRAIVDYAYDLQGAVYCELFEASQFVLIAVEEKPPHDVVPYELSPAMLRNAARKLEQAAAVIRQAEKTGLWPGRSAYPVLLEPPEWDLMGGVSFESDADE
jgi:hypothetical protein